MAVTLSLVLVCASGVAAQVSEAGQSLSGCFKVEVGQWDKQRSPSLQRQFTLPDTIKILKTRGEKRFEKGQLLLRPFRPNVTRQDWAYWSPQRKDSVRLVWTTGFVVTEVRAQIRGDSLVGMAEGSNDVGGAPRPKAPFRATRTECDSDV